jgi:hypothetical protein
MMALSAQRVDTWAASLEDLPGGLAAKLEALAAVGVNLEFVIARRAPEKPGAGVVFVTPIAGAAQTRAAAAAGFSKSTSLHTVRVEGPDKAGLGAKLTQAIAAKGINLRGFSAAAIGRKFVAHIAVDSSADAASLGRLLRSM